MHALLLLAQLGCSGSNSSATDTSAGPSDTGNGSTEPGTLSLSFAMDPDWMETMDEEPVGTFYGAIYRDEDVSSIGPAEGAESLASLLVEGVDLRPDGGPTEVLSQAGPLDPGKVVILGFLDSDGNAVPDEADPDDDDPVTLPGDNRFTVVAGSDAQAEIYFGLLNP